MLQEYNASCLAYHPPGPSALILRHVTTTHLQQLECYYGCSATTLRTFCAAFLHSNFWAKFVRSAFLTVKA